MTFKLPSEIYVICQYPENLVFIQDYSEPSPMSNTLHTVIYLIHIQPQEGGIFIISILQIRKWRGPGC